MGRETRGKGTNTRHVCDILPQTEPADSLLVVEVITPNGSWSSYPPHKHDTDNMPSESQLEEIYYHRLQPPQGFAFQRVYTDDRSLDETMVVHDGDVVMVPRGYHPAGAPHGYDLYYLNVMAGPQRVWKFKNDSHGFQKIDLPIANPHVCGVERSVLNQAGNVSSGAFLPRTIIPASESWRSRAAVTCCHSILVSRAIIFHQNGVI